MGDSLTAGIGIFATNLLDLFIENRGASFTIGGEKSWRTYLTLPNIFKVCLLFIENDIIKYYFIIKNFHLQFEIQSLNNH